jgi:hypothetical protein
VTTGTSYDYLLTAALDAYAKVNMLLLLLLLLLQMLQLLLR